MSTTQSPNYWKSLNQIAQNETYQKFADREFQEGASELSDGLSRKSFLQVMGASIALAGLASCRRPVEKILPYYKQPEQSVVGNPIYYATGMPFAGYLHGIVAESKEGRPTKLEGNPDQDASMGRTNIFHQAAILGLYDPDRARKVRHNGEESSWENFVAFCAEHFADGSRSVAVLSEANNSQTLNRLRQGAGNATWVTYEPFGDENQLAGNDLAFGSRLRSDVRYDRAQVVLSIDADFLNLAVNNVENVRRFTDRRRMVDTDASQISRLYSVESTYTVTGSNADHRRRMKPSDIQAFAFALAGRLSGIATGYDNYMASNDFLEMVAIDLRAHAGNCVVVAGDSLPAEVHAAVAAVNVALGNVGTTVSYKPVSHTADGDQTAALKQLAADLQSGSIDTLVLLGTNPVFNAPSDLNMAEAVKRASTVIQLSDYADETTRNGVTWHIPRTHFLEAWGDGASPSGQAGIIQPLIQPLFGAKSEIEVMNAVFSGQDVSGYELVRSTWLSQVGGEDGWRTALNDGVIAGTGVSDASVSLSGGLSASLQAAMGSFQAAPSGVEVSFKPDNHVYDGRFSNNSWLQEFPDPITKITWDNVVLVSPATAKALNIPDVHNSINNENDTSKVRVTVGGQSVEAPVWILPGHADDCLTILCGNGSRVGKVSNEVGTNMYPLRGSSGMYAAAATVESTGGLYMIACTQDHHSMEGRPLYRQTTVADFEHHPDFAQHMVEVPGKHEGEEFAITLFDAQTYPEYEPQWGMVIDLNSCIGCGVCTVACQAENNIPVIGKREVSRSREMQWIRVDRYFVGDDVDNPQMVHQPIPCMHCELAPCEQVCPVAATTHSDDGLNQMTYNRCIGTRYCSNNCPYKVRRFNFFNYAKIFLEENNIDDPEVLHMAMNPDVTIRFRGVMEKCTYCVQRINREKIATKIATDSAKPADGTVMTACQQACPANAIMFGDLTDPNSKVRKAKTGSRNYVLLEELNVRPRTSYLARVNNPNGEAVHA